MSSTNTAQLETDLEQQTDTRESQAPVPVDPPPDSEKPLVSARVAYALAALSGLLYFAAFPGIDVWPLAFVALAPLMVALKGQSPRRGLVLGWISGFTMTMLGFYWLLEMLQTFSGFPAAICLIFMAILCGYQAGRIGLMGWLTARASRRGWAYGPVFASAFIASEQVFPLLFPWYFGASVHQVPVLLQLAELGGPILVALPLIAANWAIAELAIARLERRSVRWKWVAGLACVPLLSVGYGAIRMPMVDGAAAQSEPVRVGLVQANMSLMGKRRNRQEGLRRHLRLTRDLQELGPLDLVVWSETSVAGAVREDEAALFYPMLFTRRLKVPAIFGAVLARPVNDARGHVLFNSALMTNVEGQVIGRYDKHYLLAFGEYLPFGSTFPVLYEWSPHSGRFTPGTELSPLPYQDRRVATLICYEDIIPGFVNSVMREGNPELLVNLTNDAWFGNTTEPWIHLALAKFRAVEQRRYFVRSTNSGVSAFVDPVGRVLAHTGTFRPEALVKELRWLTGSTPYRAYGDSPWWLISAAAFGLSFWRRPKRRSQDSRD